VQVAERHPDVQAGTAADELERHGEADDDDGHHQVEQRSDVDDLATTSNVLTVTGLTSSGDLKAKLVSKYVAGLGKGKTSTVQIVAHPNSGWCKTAPLSKVTFHSTSITTK